MSPKTRKMTFRDQSKWLSRPEVIMRETIEFLLSLPEEERRKMEMAVEYKFTMKSPAPKFQGSQSAMKPSVVQLTLNMGSVEAAIYLCQQNLRPAILNFAHSYNCGGGFEHVGGSQEEDIFRKTSAFLSLWPHRRADDGPGVLNRGTWIGDFDETLPRKGAFYPHTECGGIYSPHVRIVRKLSQNECELWPVENIVDAPIVGVLTVAAQNVGRDPPFREDLLVQKARAALHMAVDNKHNVLVLGAFGCGYFNNPPARVASVFQRLLCTEFSSAFMIVVFAIPDKVGSNLTSFTKLFPLETCRGLTRILTANEELVSQGDCNGCTIATTQSEDDEQSSPSTDQKSKGKGRKGRGKIPGPPPAMPSKAHAKPGPKAPANAMRREKLDIDSLLQEQRKKLRNVKEGEMRYSKVGSITEPMDQICMSNDPEQERAEHSRNALYLGGLDGANMHDALMVRNIKFVISIIGVYQQAMVKNFDGIGYWRSPAIEDSPETAERLELMLDEVHSLIDAALSKGHSVLVHCMMGVSRSGSVVTSYVMKKLKLDRDQALRLVRQSRSVVNPNQGFFQMLEHYGQKCRLES